MSRRISEVPFVVGSDGSVFVNAVHFLTGTPSIGEVVERACRERGAVVVAIRLGAREAQDLFRRVDDVAGEAVGFTVGHRRRRAGTHARVAVARLGGRGGGSR